MSRSSRTLEFEIEVSGTPEAVWRAVATGPGISSWYVPHEVEEREGGAAVARFGPGPEMAVPGRVAAWEPPMRIVFDGGEDGVGLAFEWLVEPATDDTCIVRLINSGFGTGDEWDAQCDGMEQGWQLFLLNLQLHLRYFSGQTATAALPMATWPGPKHEAWARLARDLGISTAPAEGERFVLDGPDNSRLAGEIVDVKDSRLALVLDEPAPGTAFIAAESSGNESSVSIWSYLYGPDSEHLAARYEPSWQAWLTERSS